MRCISLATTNLQLNNEKTHLIYPILFFGGLYQFISVITNKSLG